MKRTLLAVVAFITLGGAAQAASIFTNAITGTNPNTANPFTSGQVADTNLTVTGIGRGAGILGTNANDRYNANNWGILAEAAAITGDKYFTFTLTPNAGFAMALTSLSFVAQGSASGAHSFAVFTSIGGFSAGNEVLTFTQSGTSAYTTVSQTANFNFTNVTSAVEIRIYAWGASNATTGTFSINNFDFVGTLAAVPEPYEYGMAFAGLLFALVVIRCRQTLVS